MKLLKVAAMAPAELGAWFYIDGVVYKQSVVWNSDKVQTSEGGLKTFDAYHAFAWDEIVKDNPNLTNVDWGSYPRGLVTLLGNEYVVECGKNMVADSVFKDKLRIAFNLPREKSPGETKYGDRVTVFRAKSDYGI